MVETIKGVCGAKLTVEFVEGKGAKVRCPNRVSEVIIPDKDVTLEDCLDMTCNKTCLALKKGRVSRKTATDEEKQNNFINLKL